MPDPIDRLLDRLVPGTKDGWPAASAAIDAAALRDALPDAERARVMAWAGALDTIDPRDDAAFIARFETEEPRIFAALLTVLYTAYYTAPTVAPLIAREADAGPREASPHFDPALIETVIAHQHGKRRL